MSDQRITADQDKATVARPQQTPKQATPCHTLHPTAAMLLQLQRTAGNRAVSRLIGQIQRQPDDDTASGGAAPAGGTVQADKIVSSGALTIEAPQIVINAAMTQAGGVLQGDTLIATTGVISPSYTPGAGNVM